MSAAPRTQVCQVNDLRDGEKREVQVGDSSVLLVRHRGEYHALASKCTHYGGPLVKGVVSTDGCITCPWHGASFNVKTGDIEDAPALDPLKTFPVVVEGDAVYVEASAEDLQSNRSQYGRCSRLKADTPRVVIVGGGSGGMATAEALCQYQFQGSITMVSAEPYTPIDRPKLSKSFNPQHQQIALRSDDQLRERGVTVHTATPATGIDTEQRQVVLKDGRQLAYDTLVLATGGIPNVPPFPHVDLNNVFTLRSAVNAQSIAQALIHFAGGQTQDDVTADKMARVRLVVIGSSFISMEYASVAKQQGVDVTVIGMTKVPFQAALGEQVGGALADMHRDKGVKLRMECKVKGLVPSQADPQRVGAVELDSGEQVPADVVLLGVGVKPNTEWLAHTAIPRLKDQSIEVNDRLQVKGFTDIYAVGDIASHPSPMGNTLARIEHWDVAQNMGRCVGLNIARGPSPYRAVPYFWTMQFGKSLRYCGHALEYDDVIIHGSLKEGRWAAFFASK
ncbi:Apoptosis-inducing factor 1 [Dimargaris xerosporica]|nr:Apoptosis-inducing factor 1 [Dimargaris xerosporica]